MNKKHEYDIEAIKRIIAESVSVRQVLDKLEIVPAGGNYKTIQKFIKQNNIDTSHFTGMWWNKGKILGKKYPIEYYLKENTYKSSHDLKKRILSSGIKKKFCENCGRGEWEGVDIPLELHHINSDNTDNRIENLQLLCPNCHALTENYRGKAKAKKIISRPFSNLMRIRKPEKYCTICNKSIDKNAKTGMCQTCYKISIRKVDRPSKENLNALIEEHGLEAVGRIYGVSGNAVKKWLKNYS